MTRTSQAGESLEKRLEKQGGYTLLELLVVLAIVALMASLVGAHWSGNRNAGNVQLEAYRLEAALRSARSEAMTSGTQVAFKIDVGDRTWRYSNHPSSTAGKGISLSVYSGQTLIAKDSAAIVFFPNGQSTGGHVILRSDSLEKQIDVDWLTGRIHGHNDLN